MCSLAQAPLETLLGICYGKCSSCSLHVNSSIRCCPSYCCCDKVGRSACVCTYSLWVILAPAGGGIGAGLCPVVPTALWTGPLASQLHQGMCLLYGVGSCGPLTGTRAHGEVGETFLLVSWLWSCRVTEFYCQACLHRLLYAETSSSLEDARTIARSHCC